MPDMQQQYVQMGYRLTPQGGVEFLYVVVCTNKHTGKRAVSVFGSVSWSGDNHDPAVTMSQGCQEDSHFRYVRTGPFANRVQVEREARDIAARVCGDPMAYGLWATGGFSQCQQSEFRKPFFR